MKNPLVHSLIFGGLLGSAIHTKNYILLYSAFLHALIVLCVLFYRSRPKRLSKMERRRVRIERMMIHAISIRMPAHNFVHIVREIDSEMFFVVARDALLGHWKYHEIEIPQDWRMPLRRYIRIMEHKRSHHAH